jgi:hypothetical protein
MDENKVKPTAAMPTVDAEQSKSPKSEQRRRPVDADSEAKRKDKASRSSGGSSNKAVPPRARSSSNSEKRNHDDPKAAERRRRHNQEQQGHDKTIFLFQSY